MRLKEMREAVKRILAYKPESRVFDEDVDQRIVASIAAIWTGVHRWTFTEGEALLPVLPDIVGSATGAQVSVTNDGRKVLFSGPVSELADEVAYLTPLGPNRSWVGQVFELQGREYEILEVSASFDGLVLAEPIRLTSGDNAEDFDEWRMKWIHTYLPPDCSEILGITSVDQRDTASPQAAKLVGLPARRAEELDLRHDITGEPTCYVVGTNVQIPAAGRTTAAADDGDKVALPSVYGFVDVTRYVEVTWAYMVGGRVGPLAEPATPVALPTDPAGGARLLVTCYAEDGLTPAVTGTQDYDNRPYPLDFEGLRKVFFFNANLDPLTGLRKGPPSWRLVNWNATVASNQRDSFPLVIRDDQGTVYVNQARQVSPGNPRLVNDPDGVYQRIRLYPRPSYAIEYPQSAVNVSHYVGNLWHRSVLCRYTKRPPIVAEAGETPGIPSEFHMLVVYDVAADFMRSAGDPSMARDYEKRVETGIKALVSRYTSRIDSHHRRSQWGGGGAVSPWSRSAIVTKES